MSDSLETIAQDYADTAAAIRRCAKAFPNARFETLWDGGPRVLVCYKSDALDIATGIHLASEGRRVVAVPYVEVGGKGHRTRVYVLPSMGASLPDAQGTIDRLPIQETLAAMRRTK